MTNSEISEEAARRVKAIMNSHGEYNNRLALLFMLTFADAAQWRINSVWHDVKERPDENEPTIIEKNNGKTFFAEKGYKGPWKYNVEQFGFKRWSYIKDLMPTEE